jgi:hypothetical protein
MRLPLDSRRTIKSASAIAQDKTIEFWDISTGSAILPLGVAHSAIAIVGINLPNTVDVTWSDDV